MQLTANARRVLERRYLGKDDTGQVIETPEEMCRRVAQAVARAGSERGLTAAEQETLATRFEGRMTRLEFLPNSPALMNAGRPLGQLSACFVVPVEDTTGGLFRAIGWAAEIQKTGGGTGFAFSRLRPEVGSPGTELEFAL